MELHIDNKQKIEFVLQEKEYEWYSSINILNKKFEFYFKNQEHINWEEIRKRIIYFIKYNDAIFEVALKGAIDYQKWLGYNLGGDDRFALLVGDRLGPFGRFLRAELIDRGLEGRCRSEEGGEVRDEPGKDRAPIEGGIFRDGEGDHDPDEREDDQSDQRLEDALEELHPTATCAVGPDHHRRDSQQNP